MELDFKADDFRSHQCPPLGDNPRTYDRVAEFVNLRIKERLAKAPQVCKSAGYGHVETWVELDNENMLDGKATHTAKLVDIKGCK
jgi:hypothetical protein